MLAKLHPLAVTISCAIETANSGRGDTLDAVAENLAMTVGAALAQTVASFDSTRLFQSRSLNGCDSFAHIRQGSILWTLCKLLDVRGSF